MKSICDNKIGNFESIPKEIAAYIYSYLTDKELRVISSVNKYFRHLFSEQETLAHLLNERKGNHVNIYYLSLVEKAGSYLKKISVTILQEKDAKFLTKHCKNIREISFSAMSVDKIIVILKDLSYLQSLKINNKITDQDCQHLESLTSLQSLKINGYFTAHGIDKLSRLTLLQFLDIKGYKINGDQNLEKFINLSKNIKTMCLNGNITNHGLQHLTQLNTLQSFSINTCKRTTNEGLKYLTHFSTLQSFSIVGCHEVTGEGLEKYLGYSTSLRKITVKFCDLITRANVEQLKRLLGNKTEIQYACTIK